MPETLPPVCETMGHSDRPGPTVMSPTAGETEDVINDEVLIEAPPNRPCGTIHVKLAYAGQSAPIPAEDPGITSMSAHFENDPEFNDPTSKLTPRRGFTLIEAMVVIGIIALLFALLLPAVRSGAGPAARRAQCTNNLKQIALALYNYEQEHKVLPPAYTVDAAGQPLHSWRTLILPYLEQGALYQTIDLSKPWNDPANARALKAMPPVFRCPGAVGRPNTTSYLAMTGPHGYLDREKSRRVAEITDGTASTVAVIEADDEHAISWMAPVDADESLVLGLGPTAKLHHPGGFNAAFADGSVRFLKASLSAPVRRALMTIDGKETITTDQY